MAASGGWGVEARANRRGSGGSRKRGVICDPPPQPRFCEATSSRPGIDIQSWWLLLCVECQDTLLVPPPARGITPQSPKDEGGRGEQGDGYEDAKGH